MSSTWSDAERSVVRACVGEVARSSGSELYQPGGELEACVESSDLPDESKSRLSYEISSNADEAADADAFWRDCMACQQRGACGPTFEPGGGLTETPVDVLRRVGFGALDPAELLEDPASLFDIVLGGPEALLTASLDESADAQEEACDDGDGVKCVVLGVRHLEGDGVGEDPTTALAYFERACELGTEAGCELASQMLRYGAGVFADPTRALDLLGGGDGT